MQIFNKKKRGFTLVELLVVIAIIGMLTGIVLVSLGNARSKARDAKRQADIRQISTAMEMFYSDNNNNYATTTGPLSWTASGTLSITAIGSYLDPLPKDPGGGSETGCNNSELSYHAYLNTGTTTEYCIWACLETSGVNKYFVASEKGTQAMAAAPTSGSCW